MTRALRINTQDRAAAWTMLSLLLNLLAQGPGNGVSKTTYAAGSPLAGLEFMLKYLPTTAAIDSCVGNQCTAASFLGETTQGRAQLVEARSLAARSCKLYSKVGGTSVSAFTAVSAPLFKGADCKYAVDSSFSAAESMPMFAAFAHDSDTCCKACAATSGCVGATYEGSGSSYGSYTYKYEGDGMPEVGENSRRLQPMPGEGFGLHLVDVTSAQTSGGIDAASLEAAFTARLGDMSAFDSFMDYSVQLFAANLTAYAHAFAADGVPHLAATWLAEQGTTHWYSLFVRVPTSQMIIELVGPSAPSGYSTTAMPLLEPRMSPRTVTEYSRTIPTALNLLSAVSVSRAVSNMSAIEKFYTDVVEAKATHTVDEVNATRRCYQWGTARSDVCFVQRPDAATRRQAGARDAKAALSVADVEQMLWNVHASIMGDDPNGGVNDKYTDNHYAVDLQSSGDYLAKYWEAHNPFPITASTRVAYACKQSYLIDPTGWSIQVDLFFESDYPGCMDTKSALVEEPTA